MTRPRRFIIQPHIFLLGATQTTWLLDTRSSEPAEEFTRLGGRTGGVGFSWVSRRTAANFRGDGIGHVDSWCSFEIVELDGGDTGAAMGLRFVVGARVCPCTPDATVCGTTSVEETDFGCISWTIVVVDTRYPCKLAQVLNGGRQWRTTAEKATSAVQHARQILLVSEIV